MDQIFCWTINGAFQQMPDIPEDRNLQLINNIIYKLNISKENVENIEASV